MSIQKVSGKAVVTVDKYIDFNPAAPEKTSIHRFTYLNENSLDDNGALASHWTSSRYRLVGMADITVEFHSRETMKANAITALEAEKAAVLAAAIAKAGEIDDQIRNLQALGHDGGAE